LSFYIASLFGTHASGVLGLTVRAFRVVTWQHAGGSYQETYDRKQPEPVI